VTVSFVALGARRELLRVKELVLDVGLQRLDDLPGAHAVGIGRSSSSIVSRGWQ
jgi:hypothetical protein